MIYSDELERLKPLFWVALACLGFWAFTIWNFPRWTFFVLAAATGILLSLAFGDWLNRRVRDRRADREIDETLRRKKIQDGFDQL
jgi:hypothetical protein